MFEGESSIKPDFLKKIGYDKKYHLLSEGSSLGGQVVEQIGKIVDLSKKPKLVCRFFDESRLTDMLFSGTDRGAEKISFEPTNYGRGFVMDTQPGIMKARSLSDSDVIWGLGVNSTDLATIVEGQLQPRESVAIYDPDQLEELDHSFYTFTGNAQKALLGVFGRIDLFGQS